MRKHDVRKWLHAILDLLPLVVIPVFMVYSHRHAIDSYSVVAPKYEKVQVEQHIINGKPNYPFTNIIVEESDEVTYEENSLCVSIPEYSEVYVTFLTDIDTFDGKYLINFSSKVDENVLTSVNIYIIGADELVVFEDLQLSNSFVQYQYVKDCNSLSVEQLNFTFVNETDNTYYIYLNNVEIFDLTEMFGSGNEPTVEQFNEYFLQDYYPTDSKASVLIQNGTVTYDKTDIGNQMFYSLYNTVEQQFNFTKVFNFGDLYNFLNLNLFGGNAPLSIFVIYNIIIYEFLMDMLFIIYSVLMFLIDFVEDMFDKVFTRSKHGGS